MEQYFELTDMIYEEECAGDYRTLMFGIYKGRHFFIVNLGGQYPVAYAEQKPMDPNDHEILNDILYNSGANEAAIPHGGLTYGPDTLCRLKRDMSWFPKANEILNLHYWGWDYAHIGDYCTWKERAGLEEVGLLRKHSSKEIYEKDIVPFIDYMSEKFVNINIEKNQKEGGK